MYFTKQFNTTKRPPKINIYGSVRGNEATNGNGGGIYSHGSSLSISKGTIDEDTNVVRGSVCNNTAGGNGGGICSILSSLILSESPYIYANTAYGNGGGIYVKQICLLYPSYYYKNNDNTSVLYNFSADCAVIVDNKANKGGGIYAEDIRNNFTPIDYSPGTGGGYFELKNVKMIGNEADYGSFMYCKNCVCLLMLGTTEISGTLYSICSGNYYDRSDMPIENSILSSNPLLTTKVSEYWCSNSGEKINITACGRALFYVVADSSYADIRNYFTGYNTKSSTNHDIIVN